MPDSPHAESKEAAEASRNRQNPPYFVQPHRAVKPILAGFSHGLYIRIMITTLQAWGNSQGVRLPKALLTALQIEPGASVEIALSPGKDAIIVKPVVTAPRVRGRHRIEDLIAAMPKNYKAAEFDWGTQGRETW
jgi:antitoxin MazE